MYNETWYFKEIHYKELTLIYPFQYENIKVHLT